MYCRILSLPSWSFNFDREREQLLCRDLVSYINTDEVGQPDDHHGLIIIILVRCRYGLSAEMMRLLCPSAPDAAHAYLLARLALGAVIPLVTAGFALLAPRCTLTRVPFLVEGIAAAHHGSV